MSLEESCCHGKLCKSFQLYIVTGLRTSCAPSAISCVLTEKDKFAFKEIRNWFGIGKDRCGVLFSVEDIRGKLKEPNTCNCEKITKVFIAHSYGAQTFYEALTKWEVLPMRTFKICQRTALIGIAGVTLFPKDTVQITKNFAFSNDKVCEAGKALFEKFGKEECDLCFLGPFHRTGEKIKEDFKCNCCKVPMDSKQPTGDQERPKSESEARSFCNSEEQNDSASTESAPSVNLSWKKKHMFIAHYLYDYVCCKTLEKEIKHLLVSNDN